jgi:hypothetical protein
LCCPSSMIAHLSVVVLHDKPFGFASKTTALYLNWKRGTSVGSIYI